MKIKKGDNVIVITGKDKGRKGKVLRVLPKEGKIVVENINRIIKHIRPKKQGEKGQRVEMSVPFNISNVKLICPKCGKPTRAGYRILDKNKVRICKKCKEIVD